MARLELAEFKHEHQKDDEMSIANEKGHENEHDDEDEDDDEKAMRRDDAHAWCPPCPHKHQVQKWGFGQAGERPSNPDEVHEEQAGSISHKSIP